MLTLVRATSKQENQCGVDIISYHIYDAYIARDKVGIASRNDDCEWIYLLVGWVWRRSRKDHGNGYGERACMNDNEGFWID